MNSQLMTQQEIRQAGIDILSQYMGIVGMIRFLQQTETGSGDYTKEREKLLGNPSLEDLVNDIQVSGLNQQNTTKR